MSVPLARPITLFALFALCFAVAGYAIFAYGFLPLGSLQPSGMRATFEAYSVAVYLHVFGAIFALTLGPFQFLPGWRVRHLQLHRWLGRLYLGVGVLLGGVSGLFMAMHAYSGLTARIGFACLALAWLYTGYRGFVSIRARNMIVHRQWMIRNFSLTLAAVTLRLYLPITLALGIEFETAYPIIAWLCWIPNLLIAERFAKAD